MDETIPRAARIGRRALPAACVALALALPLRAAALTLTLASAHAVWNQPLAVTVSGFGCNAALTVDAPSRALIAANVQDLCPAGLDPLPFTVTKEIRDFPPGVYTVVATDSSGNQATQPLELHFAGQSFLEMPAVASSTDPTPFSVSFYGSPCDAITSTVSGQTIDVKLDLCGIDIPPQPSPMTVPVAVGPLAPGTYHVLFHDLAINDNALVTGTLLVRAAQLCFPSNARLCLQDGRFAVSGAWRAFDGSTGVAHAAPLAGNEQSGLLWFFDRSNTEITIKVLQGCALNQSWWTFLSSASTVEYDVTIEDLITGRSRTYHNDLGQTPALIADTAMEVCP